MGELVQTYTDEAVIYNGKIDIAKVRPLLFDIANIEYWSLGPVVGNCWNVGKTFKK